MASAKDTEPHATDCRCCYAVPTAAVYFDLKPSSMHSCTALLAVNVPLLSKKLVLVCEATVDDCAAIQSAPDTIFATEVVITRIVACLRLYLLLLLGQS
jgi:hypothetical protein